MGSKLVINRQKSSETVRSAATNYLGKIEQQVAKQLGADAGAAAATMIQAAVTKLDGLTKDMVVADDAHLNEVSDDSMTIATRDETAAMVRAGLMEVRELCGTVFGAEYVRKLGFDGNTPSDAVQLARLGAQVLENMDTKPESARFGLTLDLGQFKDKLAPQIDGLTQAVAAVSEDTRQADIKLVEKRKTMDAYDEEFSATANLISTLLKLAGEDELARRVRPSSRRPGQTVEDAEDIVISVEEATEQTQVEVA